jgi:peptidoglycan/LPS O-acetylase OafA/YrhL
LRIFPAYYLALLLSPFLFPSMRDVLGWHALYLSNLYPVWHGAWPPIGAHFWSLSVEEQFYLFWPLIVLAFPPRKVMFAALTCCLLAPLSRLLIWQSMKGPAVWTVTTSALDLLCFGGFLACARYQNLLPPGGRYTNRLRLAGLVALLVYIVIYSFLRESLLFVVAERTLTSLFFGAVILAAANGFKGPASWLLGNPFVVWLGTISYGLYIFHPFIVQSYPRLLDLWGAGRETAGVYYVRVPLMGIMLLLVTSASYYCLERPVRGLRKYFL